MDDVFHDRLGVGEESVRLGARISGEMAARGESVWQWRAGKKARGDERDAFAAEAGGRSQHHMDIAGLFGVADEGVDEAGAFFKEFGRDQAGADERAGGAIDADFECAGKINRGVEGGVEVVVAGAEGDFGELSVEGGE
jgi:hypothetical protein